MIIGMCGAARSGKDTVAGFLADMASDPSATFTIQISGPLKAYVRDVFEWTTDHTDGDLKDEPDQRYARPCKRCTHPKNPRPGYIDTAIDIMGYSTPRWERCPLCNGKQETYLTPRHAMQQLGGEFAEATFPAIYAHSAAAKAQRADAIFELVIITDCRFVRDIQAAKDVGGIIIEVTRPGQAIASSGHSSETARDTEEFQALVDHTASSTTARSTTSAAWSRASPCGAQEPDDSGSVSMDYETPTTDGEVTDKRLVPGCWFESKRFGPSVLISVEPGHFRLRYEATHLQTQQTIWVGNGDAEGRFLRPADGQSMHVLTLEGPYGLGPGRSDPRMP